MRTHTQTQKSRQIVCHPIIFAHIYIHTYTRTSNVYVIQENLLIVQRASCMMHTCMHVLTVFPS